ncbi:MAG TPA: hypothetical protein PLE24_06360 [Chitinispirillaceae bacterium]|nr:hypothetical protein [Chitinispirillaceae bacterium]
MRYPGVVESERCAGYRRAQSSAGRTKIRQYERTTVRQYDSTTARQYDNTTTRQYDSTTTRQHDSTTGCFRCEIVT